jgi:hypothetical protein
MSVPAFTTRPLTKELLVTDRQGTIEIARLKGLPNGHYVVFAKLIVVTRVDDRGADSAIAQFSLEAQSPFALGTIDKAITTLWHSADRGAFQPADTVSLHLATTLTALAHNSGSGVVTGAPQTSSVVLFCSSSGGILEIRDIVITAIKVESLEIVP